MSPATATSRSDSRAPGKKGVLFCPDCWHESPVDGDWQVHATEAGDRLDCPACGETVTHRPTASAETATITLPVVAGSLALARLTTHLLVVSRRLCAPEVNRDGTSRSPSTTAEFPGCHP
jgi:hypothetical protein